MGTATRHTCKSLGIVVACACLFVPALGRAQADVAPAPTQAPARAPSQAPADATDSPEYRAAIDEAVQSFSNQDWPAARVAFARAHELSPSARTCRGLGLSLFYLRDYVGARIAFEKALAETRKPLSPEQRQELERFLGSAKLETGRYELRVSPASAHVTLDAMPRQPGVVVLARGSHDLLVEASGYASRHSSVVVNGGEDTVLEFSLVTLAAAPTTTSAAFDSSVPTNDSWPAPESGPAAEPRSRLFTWIALGAVPVFAGIGTGVWFAGKGKYDEIKKVCDSGNCDTKRVTQLEDDAHLSRYATWSTVSFIAAGAALATGGVLFFVEGSSGDRRSGSADQAKRKGPPMFSVGPAGAVFTTQF